MLNLSFIQNLKPRERVLFGLTLAAVFGFLVYQFGLGGILDEFSDRAGKLQTEETEHTEAWETIKTGGDIVVRYSRVAGQLQGADSRLRPAQQFTEEVNEFCRSLGITNPRIDPVETQAIEGVEDYEYLILVLRTEGNLQTAMQLLKAFESKKLLFQGVELSGGRDRENVEIKLKISRLVSISEKEQKARERAKARKNRSSRSSSSI